MPSDNKWTLLARILRPQGRKGEVLADLFTDFPDRFASQPNVWLAPSGFSEAQETDLATEYLAPEAVQISAHWLPLGRNTGKIVLLFSGVTSISAAKQLAGKEVVIPTEARMALEPGTAYISDLLGCKVYDRGRLIGAVEDVQFATTPDGTRRLEEAAPLLVVQSSEAGEVLIPFAKQYLVEVDTAAKRIRMDLPEGLAEVNTSGSD
jgi:16S rRNA processing protein RimM